MENDKNCIFCKIVNNEIPSYKICENDKAMCFLDINPIANGHCVVIPKKHFRTFSQTDDEYVSAMTSLAKKVVNKINESKLDAWGFNYLINEEAIAGQKVFHTHLHIIPKYAKHEGLCFDVSKIIVEQDIEKILKKINKKKLI